MASRPAGIVTFEFNPELNKLGKGKALSRRSVGGRSCAVQPLHSPDTGEPPGLNADPACRHLQ